MELGMPRNRIIGLVLLVVTATAFAQVRTHDLTGRWIFSVVTENGTGTPTVDLKQEGEKLTGTYVSNAMGTRTLEGTVRGDTMRFVLASTGQGEGVVLTYVAHIVTADSLNGYVDFGGMGEARLTGKRQR
jgi:hypothetical protein